jgi:hypothetical protein
MIEYWDGGNLIEVEELNYLNNLSQEQLNNIAVGPQDLFFDIMNNINREFERVGILKGLDVTNKWNWKPGSYDIFKEYLGRRLELNKKCRSMDNLVNRTRDRNNYLNYIQRQAQNMERERYSLKRLGVSRDVDVNKFQTICREFTTAINKQCQLVKEMTNDKILITPYIRFQNNVMYYMDIKINGLTMSIYSGDKDIQQFPLDEIHIISRIPFRHLVNKQRIYDIYHKGIYMSNFKFPYISSSFSDEYPDEQHYSTVCYDKYMDNIHKAIKETNYTAMALYIMQWAQYYSLEHSNPYNQPHKLHYGMPKSYSKEYASSCNSGTVIDACNRMMTNQSGLHTFWDKDIHINEKCFKIDCQLINDCRGFKKRTQSLANMEEYSDIAESIACLLMEYYKENNYSYRRISREVEALTYYYISHNSDNFIDECYRAIIYYIVNSQKNNRYCYDLLVKLGLLKEEELEDAPNTMDTEELEFLMKQWAQSGA